MMKRIRVNIMLLVGMGYLTVGSIFASLAFGDLSAAEAYENVQNPLMALIGGSLALAKDLVSDNPDPANSARPPDQVAQST